MFSALCGAMLLQGCTGAAGSLLNAAGQAVNAATNGSSTSGSTSSSKGFPASVTAVESKANQVVSVKGNLDNGMEISDLSWASSSSVACFPATQNSKFRAKHVLFSTSLPPRSILKITAKPTDESKDLSIYAYQVGTNNFSVVPNLPSAVSCEAEHKWDYPKKDQVQTSARSVSLNATTNPYNVVIGVTGPAGASGEFTLEIELEQ
jgi:hypothetical protein